MRKRRTNTYKTKSFLHLDVEMKDMTATAAAESDFMEPSDHSVNKQSPWGHF